MDIACCRCGADLDGAVAATTIGIRHGDCDPAPVWGRSLATPHRLAAR